MNKQEFLSRLRKQLKGLEDKEERITFYSEMIDDRMEEGLSEEEAVAAVGSLDGFGEMQSPKRKGLMSCEMLMRNIDVRGEVGN